MSDVDSFEGLETATGNFVRAKVAGLRTAAACQKAESLTTAENFLRGKKVRLSIRKTSSPASDRMFVDVRLPDGKDYAQNIVHDGAALADSATRGELTATESAARQERRGLWSAPCAPNDPNPTASISTSSTTATSASTGTASATQPPLSQSPHPPGTPPAATTTSVPQPPADDVHAGKPCSPEGARGKTSKGDDVVCVRNGKNELRWRKP